MKVLVTGASGFIGSHLVTMLKARGDGVRTINHTELLEPLLNLYDIEHIYHLAAFGNMATQKSKQGYDAEVFVGTLGTTFNLLDELKDVSYQAFINVSSSSVLLPHQTMYSATKLGAEALCKAYFDEYNKPIATIRPYSVYGPGEAEHRFIPTIFRSCLNGEPMTLDPDATHDWVYIDDVVRALINTADNIEQFKGKALNIGTGFGYSNSQVVQIIEDITDKRANVTETKRLRSYDSENWKSDTRAGEYIKLREGLTKYYDSIR